MGGGFLVVVVWAAVWVWAGRGLLLAEGRVADRRALVCGVVGLSGAWYRRHTRSGGLLRLLWLWWSDGGGCPCVCGGGMLSGCWGSAPWLPDPCSAALCGWWGWVWVGWL